MAKENSTLSRLVTAATAAAVTYEAYAIYTRRKTASAENAIDEETGITIKGYPLINGVHHYVQIHGKDRTNPVLLYVHGGPGEATSAYSHSYQKEWESFFTYVLYDQRGCGLSEKSDETLDLGLYVEDLKGVVNYIRSVLPDIPIVLFGQSWGSVIAAAAALKYPELFTAYIGTGQVVHVGNTLRASYNRAKECAHAENNEELWNALVSAEVKGNDCFYSPAYLRAKARYGFGSVKYNALSLAKNLYDDVTACPYMNLQDCVKSSLNSVSFSAQYRYFIKSDSFMNINLEDCGTEFKIPVYLIEGSSDWQAPYTLAREWYEKISAPEKKWLVVDKAAHMVQYDNLPELTGYLWGIKKELFEQERK